MTPTHPPAAPPQPSSRSPYSPPSTEYFPPLDLAERSPSLFEVLAPISRARRILVRVPLAVAVAVIALSFLVPKRYTATTSFVAEAGSLSLPGGLASLAGLAGQMGIGGLGRGPSPNTFAEILKSRELLTATLLSRFPAPEASAGAAPKPLLDILEIEGATERERVDEGVRLLSGRVATRVGRLTEIVTVSVELEGSELSAAVANRMVQLLNQFNLERRQTQSREQRRFAGERTEAAERELRSAEANQLRFLQTNRRYQDSPLLQFEANRLEREVQLRQELFQTLSRKYEEARIAEVQDTPVLTVIDAAVAPEKKSYPRRLLTALLAAALTVIALFVGIFVREYWDRAKRADPDGYGRLGSADPGTVVRRLSRLLRTRAREAV